MEKVELSGVLNNHQQEIINTLMSDQTLLKFLYYNKNEDILNKPELNKKQAKQIRDNNIFNFKRIPTINDKEMITYISMEFDKIGYTSNFNSKQTHNQYWVAPSYVFYIINHYQNDDTQNGSRINAIEDRIVDLFHCKNNISSIGISVIQYSQPIIGLTHPYIGRALYISFIDKNVGKWNG